MLADSGIIEAAEDGGAAAGAGVAGAGAGEASWGLASGTGLLSVAGALTTLALEAWGAVVAGLALDGGW